ESDPWSSVHRQVAVAVAAVVAAVELYRLWMIP
ncbi:unnamed protein product, partial [marine sediment metagenome]